MMVDVRATGGRGTAAATSSPGAAAAEAPAPPRDKGLKADAIGLLSSVVIGVASTAPAYSLAASLGLVVKPAGIHAPGILLLAFAPMLCLALAFHYLNRVEPDCGTSFRWVARAFGPVVGPYAGWMAGWSAIIAGVMVMASLAQITGAYTFELLGLERLAKSRVAVAGVGVGFIALLTWLCVRGITVAARLQWVLLAVEVVVLLVFAAVALQRVYAGAPPAGAVRPAAAWLNPFGAGAGPLASGFLAALFIYWGWDSAVSCNEETRDRRRTPGRAAVTSVLILLVLYAVTSVAAQAVAGPAFLVQNSADVLAALGRRVLSPAFHTLLLVAVLTSATASTQTTILPTGRATLSMALAGALPAALGRVSARYQTPHVATIVFGLVAAGFYVTLALLSADVLADAVLALGLMIAFNYVLVGLACVLTFVRRRGDWRTFVGAVVLPGIGTLVLLWVLVRSLGDLARPGAAGKVLGMGVPLAAGLGSLLLGVVLMVAQRCWAPRFFGRPRTAPDESGDRP